MKKVVAKKTEDSSKRFDRLEKKLDSSIARVEASIDKLAEMTLKGFTQIDARFKDIEKTMATKADVLDLHDKFIHRREFDQLSLRVSKLEEKARR